MNINISTSKTLNNEILFIFEENIQTLENISKCKHFQNIINSNLFSATKTEVYPIAHDNKNIILIGLGKAKEFDMIEFIEKTVVKTYKSLKQLHIDSFVIDFSLLSAQNILTETTLIKEIIRAFINASYIFDKFLKAPKNKYKIKEIELFNSNMVISIEEASRFIKIGKVIGECQNYAKDLQNLPANICSTEYMLTEAKKLDKKHSRVSVSYLDKNKLEKEDLNLLLAVSKGSKMPPYMVSIDYRGSKDKSEDPVVIIGKGVIFDSGGMSLKPSTGMMTMKMDMGGSGTTLATMKAIAELELPINVIGVMALAENAIDANSYRPGDIFKSKKGITVEINNTDAEGRLVLADALAYVERYNPKEVIDLATLTGSVILSIGEDFTGLFANDDTLADELFEASNKSYDIAWRMPLHKPYLRKLKSEIADIDNCGNAREAGSITAALFLSKFATEYKWAHLDIAGSAMGSFVSCSASGRPVPMIMQYLINKSK